MPNNTGFFIPLYAGGFNRCLDGLTHSMKLWDRLNALSTKGHIKFFKNADVYGLPQAQRSRQGYICVEDMTLGDGTRILSTHKQVMCFPLMIQKNGSLHRARGNYDVAHCHQFYCPLPTGFAHLPTVQTLEPARVSCRGQWARVPLLLRSNADAFPTRGRAISILATSKQFQKLTTRR